jgi:hypothetical protein
VVHLALFIDGGDRLSADDLAVAMKTIAQDDRERA